MNDDRAPDMPEAAANELPSVAYTSDGSEPAPRRRGRHYGARPVRDPRSFRLDLRVTPAQNEAMRDAAQKAGLSLTAFICQQALGAPVSRMRRNPSPDTVLLAKVLAQMGKAGSNLNQIAHRMNEYDFEGIPELLVMQAEHAEALAQHREVCEAILAALRV
jgi:hypothetical protein